MVLRFARQRAVNETGTFYHGTTHIRTILKERAILSSVALDGLNRSAAQEGYRTAAQPLAVLTRDYFRRIGEKGPETDEALAEFVLGMANPVLLFDNILTRDDKERIERIIKSAEFRHFAAVCRQSNVFLGQDASTSLSYARVAFSRDRDILSPEPIEAVLGLSLPLGKVNFALFSDPVVFYSVPINNETLKSILPKNEGDKPRVRHLLNETGLSGVSIDDLLIPA